MSTEMRADSPCTSPPLRQSTVGTSICQAGGGKAEMEEAADITRCVPAHKPVV